jgi:hypothetical protein
MSHDAQSSVGALARPPTSTLGWTGCLPGIVWLTTVQAERRDRPVVGSSLRVETRPFQRLVGRRYPGSRLGARCPDSAAISPGEKTLNPVIPIDRVFINVEILRAISEPRLPPKAANRSLRSASCGIDANELGFTATAKFIRVLQNVNASHGLGHRPTSSYPRTAYHSKNCASRSVARSCGLAELQIWSAVSQPCLAAGPGTIRDTQTGNHRDSTHGTNRQPQRMPAAGR